jgi:hypothetical protein
MFTSKAVEFFFILSHKHHFQPVILFRTSRKAEKCGHSKRPRARRNPFQLYYFGLGRRAGSMQITVRPDENRWPRSTGTITRNDTLGALQIGVIAHKSAYTHLDARARGRRAKNAKSEARISCETP